VISSSVDRQERADSYVWFCVFSFKKVHISLKTFFRDCEAHFLLMKKENWDLESVSFR
jgi:hypothetical protein